MEGVDMWRLSVSSKFDAAHCLSGYPGQCKNLHGHTWRVVAVFASDVIDDLGLALDFRWMRKVLNDVLDKLDHSLLISSNESVLFAGRNEALVVFDPNPTAEVIAKYIYDSLKQQVNCISSVTVYESDNAWVEYSE